MTRERRDTHDRIRMKGEKNMTEGRTVESLIATNQAEEKAGETTGGTIEETTGEMTRETTGEMTRETTGEEETTEEMKSMIAAKNMSQDARND